MILVLNKNWFEKVKIRKHTNHHDKLFSVLLAVFKTSSRLRQSKRTRKLNIWNALVTTKDNKHVLITGTEEFIIPDDFSLESWDELKNMLWKNQNTITDISNSWNITN